MIKITYVTVGYYDNGFEIVYAGENKEIAMNTNLYPHCHEFNVDAWENGNRVRTYYKNKMIDDNYFDPEDSHFEWECYEV